MSGGVQLPAIQLMPGDRFESKGRIWVVLARSIVPWGDSGSARTQLRVIDTTTDVARGPVNVHPPADLFITVLNRDDSLTHEQAEQNLRDGGLLP